MPKKELAAVGDAMVRLLPKKAKRPAVAKDANGLDRSRHRSGRPGAKHAVIDASRIGDGVLVVTVDDVLTKNERYKVVVLPVPGAPGKKRGQIAEAPLSDIFKAAVRIAAESAGFLMGAKRIESGLWRIDVLSAWPTQRHHEDGTKTAFGDADAPVPMIKDALQKAGVIDDDMRIVQGSELSCYLKGERRVVAVLTRVDPDQHARDVDAMLARGIAATAKA